MNKKALIIVIGLLILVAAACAYVFLLPDNASMPQSNTTTPTRDQPKEETKPESPEPTPAQPGAYRPYSADAISATTGTKLLFFHAPWCPQCRELESSINADGVPDGVTVFKVDYDSNQQLRQKYGVTIQTTFVKIDDWGNKQDLYVAYDQPQFSSVEQRLLK